MSEYERKFVESEFPRVTFCMIVFNSDFFLRPVIRAVQKWGRLVVAEGPVGYWQNEGYKTSTDSTNDILDECLRPGIDAVTHGAWAEKTEQQAALNSMIQDDTEYAWLVDSDELFSDWLVGQLMDKLRERPRDSVDFRAHSFWFSMLHTLGGGEANYNIRRIQRWYPGARWSEHRPPTVLAPDGQPWATKRHWCAEDTAAESLRYWHYSMVFPSQVAMKAEYYDARGGCVRGWFRDRYVPWMMATDRERPRLERQLGGMHTHDPRYVGFPGPCYTEPWSLAWHPPEIKAEMPQIMERYDREVAQLRKRYA